MRVVLYANNIAIFDVNKTLNRDETDNVLNKDIDQLTAKIIKSNLVVNMKKSKTECVLFGTRQNVSTVCENLKRLSA